MTESQWLASEDPRMMLEWLMQHKGAPYEPPRHEIPPSHRKLRLIKKAWESDLCGQERYCVGFLGGDGSIRSECEQVLINIKAKYQPTAANLLRDIVGNPFQQVLLPRVVVGTRRVKGGIRRIPRFHPMIPDVGDHDVDIYGCPWITPTVLSLAQSADEERPGRKCEKCPVLRKAKVDSSGYYDHDSVAVIIAWGQAKKACVCKGTGRIEDDTLDPVRMAILADALEEAGCAGELCQECKGTRSAGDDSGGNVGRVRWCDACSDGRQPSPILTHLRSPGPHVRGCYVIDLLLGLE